MALKMARVSGNNQSSYMLFALYFMLVCKRYNEARKFWHNQKNHNDNRKYPHHHG
jgi:hypothetical protein